MSVADGVILGAVLGVIFSAWNLVTAWLNPLADDTPTALLTFYGPMFLAWGVAGFATARRSGRVTEAAKVGAIVAFVTFVVFDVGNLVRVNLFLDEMPLRADWNLMARFQASGSDSLRVFVNQANVKGAPLKTGVASIIGANTGLVGELGARIGPASLRVFVNQANVKGAPLKTGVASIIGANTGLVGELGARIGPARRRGYQPGRP